MKTKLITSLDELNPGMRTKDGWEYLRYLRDGVWLIRCPSHDEEVVRHELEKIFLNQEVEVPE